MAKLTIVSVDPQNSLALSSSALRQKCNPVLPDQIEEVKKIVADLLETLYTTPTGVGLAAPQVGLLLQITVIDVGTGLDRGKKPLVLINPKVKPNKEETKKGREACLSIPSYLSNKIERFTDIHVSALDHNLEPLELDAEDFLARVIQHEVDHLNGILYPDLIDEADLKFSQEDYAQMLSEKGIKALYESEDEGEKKSEEANDSDAES